MECKDVFGSAGSKKDKGLIETLWNVKEVAQAYDEEKSSGLIETLWNVKCISPGITTITAGFNRNIVECKGQTQDSCVSSVNGLIETLWNVKFHKFPMAVSFEMWFNRNIVECKV